MKPRDNKIRSRGIMAALAAALVLVLVCVVWLPGHRGENDSSISGAQSGEVSVIPPDQSGAESTPTDVEDAPPAEEPDPPVEEPPVIVTKPNPKPVTPEKEEIASGDLTCEEYALFSGQYAEDGRDELVSNVAAILVKNRSDQFLDLATLSFDIDGKTATFIVTGLPAGRSAWVMEATKMTATHNSVFTYLDCITSFREGVVAKTDKVTIKADGNMLTAVNNTQNTLENVCVYYRTLHTDGNFFGGITYVVDFGTLEPGQSAETLAGHYDGAKSEIVRIGWQVG